MSTHDAPQSFGLPPSAVPSTRPPSVAPPSEHLIYMRNFLEETLVKLGVNNTYPLPTDRELNQDISTGEALILPLLCSSSNALASLLDKVDTLTNRLTHIHDSVSSVANTVPNKEEITASLAPITSSVRDLSHRISTAPPRHPHAPQPSAPPPPKSKNKPSPPPAPVDEGPTLDPNFPRVDLVTNICYGTLRPSPSLTLTPGRPPTLPMEATTASPNSYPVTLIPSALVAPTLRRLPPPPSTGNPKRPPRQESLPSQLPLPRPPPGPPRSPQLPAGSMRPGRPTPLTQTGTP